MKYYNVIAIMVVFSCVIAVPAAYASKLRHNAQGQNCVMVENAQIGVNFSNIAITLKSSKGYINQKADEILSIASDIGIEDIHINNFNYSINSNYGGGCNVSNPSEYRLNGNISFNIKDTDKAANLMELINEKGYKANFNMNAYRQCQ